MDINKIYNEDCFLTMNNMVKDNLCVDVILTSPPYCTPYDDCRKFTEARFNSHQSFYDVFTGFESVQAYREFTLSLFNLYDSVLKPNGVILYNLSYTSKYPELPYIILSDIINNTNFTVADCISWKKSSALPQNQNPNRLTRICEFVFVIVRKEELCSFKCNKEKSGTKYKNTHFNYIEAVNNDIRDKSKNQLNNATFSSDLVVALLNIYANTESVVYDSFMGTGTTAVGCKRFGCSYIGSEFSKQQCELADARLANRLNKKVNVKALF